MNIKPVEAIMHPQAPHFVGDGFRVHNFIPSVFSMQRMDPFIMLDYNSRYYFPPSEQARGVGVHPHRGFETVTIAYKGRIAHHDSGGNSGVIGEGDVQWMTAASGVLHKEYHEQQFSQAGGDFQMVQLWVNLPAAKKMTAPRYQAITSDQIPRVALPNKGGQLAVIAGEYQGQKGIAQTFTPMHVYNIFMETNGRAEIELPAHYHTALLVIEGSVALHDGRVARADQFVLFRQTGEWVSIVAQEKATVLLLSGEPINEPIAAHGPFVMNSKQELLEAFQDFQAGKFGQLVD